MLYPAIFILLCFIFLKPVCDSDIEVDDIVSVVTSVLSNPYSTKYPQLYPYIKVIWLLGVALGLFGWNIVFCVFCFISLMFIGTFQQMGFIEEWDYVWLVSNSVAIYFASFYILSDCIMGENDLRWCNAKKSRLWVLFLFPLLFWCPVIVSNGKSSWDFSYHSIVFSEAGTSFCYVAPTLLSVLIIFFPHVNIGSFGCLTFVCSLFGISSIIMFIQLEMTQMAIMHIPIIVVSIYGYILYFTRSKREISKEKPE